MPGRKDFSPIELRAMVAVIGIITVSMIAYYLKDGAILFGLAGVAFVVGQVNGPSTKDDFEGI